MTQKIAKSPRLALAVAYLHQVTRVDIEVRGQRTHSSH